MNLKKNRSGSKRRRTEEVSIHNAREDNTRRHTTAIKEETSGMPTSQKRLRINRSLTSKLHVLTHVEEKIIGTSTPGRVTGAKNDNLWDFRSALLEDKTFSLAASYTVLDSRVLPSIEKLRHRCVSESRDYLKQLCKDHDVIPPLMAWERWQSNSILHEQLSSRNNSNNNNKNNNNNNGGDSCNQSISFKSATNNYCRTVRSPQYSADNILPSDIEHVDRGLVQDLLRGGVKDERDALKIAEKLIIHSKELVARIQSYAHSCVPISVVALTGNKKKQRMQQHQILQATNKLELQPTVVDHKHTYDVYLGEKSKHVLKLNTPHYRKLRQLYLLTHCSSSNSIVPYTSTSPNVAPILDRLDSEVLVGSMDVDTVEDRITMGFHSSLYSMLARYNALLGHGMQCALPEHVFETLHSHVHTNFECFASPLNCRYSSYCSAFPDTDAIFGSKGSFFDFFPTSGSYEVNPPFIESIMTEAVNHAQSLLSKSREAMSFVFIIPGDREANKHTSSILRSSSTVLMFIIL